jgi:quaternary ammonium compound-resistance protein SugE
MSWIVLLAAGLLEVCWAVGLKASAGFTRPWPTLATGVSLIASLGLLGLALRTLPLGTAYAIWTGLGTAGTALVGAVLFEEPISPSRLACIALILTGIAGLKLSG